MFSYQQNISAAKLLCIGDSAPVSFFEAGDFIHAVESFIGQGAIFGRSAGTFCQVRSFTQNETGFNSITDTMYFAKIRLPSGSLRLVNLNARATLGVVAPAINNLKNKGKAGRTRWLG